MTTQEKNMLIAKFMEFDLDGREVIDYNSEFMGYIPMTYDDLEYNCSWDWLMGVVDKIESLGYDFNISKDRDGHTVEVWKSSFKRRTASDIIIDSDYSVSKFDIVFDSVIAFIEWHNNLSK